MDVTTRQELIAGYKYGYRVVAEVLEGCSEKEQDARPAPGKWSAREITHHLADSEMIAANWLRVYAEHAHTHAEQIRKARAAGR
jgi:hypothetical protein